MGTLKDLLQQSWSRRPERDAVVDVADGRRYTYRELGERARCVANALRDRGVAPDDRVAICLRNTLEHAVLQVACQLIGAGAVAFNFRVPENGVTYHVDDCGADVFVFGPASKDAVVSAREDLSASRLVYVGDETPDFADPFDRLLDAPADDPGVTVHEEHLSTIQYSSGTTGDPKGIPMTQADANARVRHNLTSQRLSYGDSMLGVMPIYHAIGSHGILLSTLAASGTYFSMPEFDPELAVETIDREGVTHLHESPTVFRELLATDAAETADFDDVTTISYVGAPMSESLFAEVEAAFDPTYLSNDYGATEAYTPLACLNLRQYDDPRLLGPSNFDNRTRIVEIGSDDPEAVVEPGVEGELIVDSDAPTVFDGYWEKPEQTDEAMVDGWYFTGDAGKRTPDGNTIITGRVDDMIISGGENIHPPTVEGVLVAHPEVDDVAVVGVPDEKWGEVPKAFVRGDADPDTLDEWCLESSDLPDFKRPRAYERVERIPTNPSGKTMRYKLRER